MKPNLDTISPLPTSTSVLQSTGRDEDSFLPEAGTQVSKLKNAPQAWTQHFPQKSARPEKKNLLSLLFDLSSIVSKAIPTKMPYRKNNHSQEKEQSSNIFLMCWIFTNSLSDCTLTPNLCWAGWSDPQRCSPGSGTVTQQKCTGLGFLPSLLSDPEHTL